MHDIGARGTDAFLHSWSITGPHGETPNAYINPPFNKLGDVIAKIREQQVDCVLLAPVWQRPWTALLKHIPIVSTRRLAHHEQGVFQPGPRAGQEARDSTPRYMVHAYTVRWQKGTP